MAHIEYSNIEHEFVACFSGKEADLLAKAAKLAAKKEEKLMKKYEDIHSSGEATEHQQTLMVLHEENFSMLTRAIELLEEATLPF